MSRVGNAIIADRQRKIYDRILAQGIEFYHSTSSSDLITRMTNNAQAARSVLDLVVTSYVRDLVTLIVLVGVMVWQQPALSADLLRHRARSHLRRQPHPEARAQDRRAWNSARSARSCR